jgi:hypothetical protein
MSIDGTFEEIKEQVIGFAWKELKKETPPSIIAVSVKVFLRLTPFSEEDQEVLLDEIFSALADRVNQKRIDVDNYSVTAELATGISPY